MEILIVLIGLILFDAAALLFGADSREGMNGEEWRRWAAWYAR